MFALSGRLPPKEMGIILGIAALLDSLLVWLMLVPILLRLTGRAAWWLHRLVPDVRFGHLRDPPDGRPYSPVHGRPARGSGAARDRVRGHERAP
jgi:uncharacterized membrane protein YdfJ with MMPL/SSD domain